MPNIFSYLVLFGWPLVSIYFYKKMNVITATFMTIVGGYLLLPVKVEVDLPLIPAFDKKSIPVLCAFIGCYFIKKIKLKLLPTELGLKVFILILIVSPFMTVLTNLEPVFNGVYWIKGLNVHDAVSIILLQYIKFSPFIIVSQIIKSDEDFVLVCKLFVISALLYSLPMLLEVRLSPQLHTWFYGFFPHDFAQQRRFDGFRPVVFLGHGLLVAIFTMAAFTISCLLWKRNIKVHPSLSPLFVMFYLFCMLILCKSVGAIVFAMIVCIFAVFLNNSLKKMFIYITLLLIFFYPALCIFNLFPHQEIIEYVMDMSPERAESLNFRFYHEALLLEHAREQILFGWGGWGRNRLPGSITDGRWIVEFGMFGIVGFVALFGLLGFSIHKTLKKASLLKSKHQIDTFMFSALILVLVLVDQIVNSSLEMWVWFFVGALLGRIRQCTVPTRVNIPQEKLSLQRC